MRSSTLRSDTQTGLEIESGCVQKNLLRYSSFLRQALACLSLNVIPALSPVSLLPPELTLTMPLSRLNVFESPRRCCIRVLSSAVLRIAAAGPVRSMLALTALYTCSAITSLWDPDRQRKQVAPRSMEPSSTPHPPVRLHEGYSTLTALPKTSPFDSLQSRTMYRFQTQSAVKHSSFHAAGPRLAFAPLYPF